MYYRVMAAVDRIQVPLLMRMAAHPLRWALMTELAASDLRVRELVEAVGEPQNLVSYHLRLLRSAGLVGARRSSFDGRDSYYHLDLPQCAAAFGDAASALHPALARASGSRAERGSVLFLCTGNSARSPMAEALVRHRIRGVRAASAGSHPKPRIHPNAVRALRDDYGIDLGAQRPQSLDALAGRSFDCVITLCDKVREVSRSHGDAVTTHWSLPDPAAGGDADHATYPQFRRLAAEIDARIGFLELSTAASTTHPNQETQS